VEWGKELIRVELDRILLFALILLFFHYDPRGEDLKLVLGALLMAIQHNRYPRSPAPPPVAKERASDGTTKV
jgi:hypothetical protein